jgi:hypothetical protein
VDASSNVSFNLNSLTRAYMLNAMKRLNPILVILSFKHWRPKRAYTQLPVSTFHSQAMNRSKHNQWLSPQDNDSPSDEWSTKASVLEPLPPSMYLARNTAQQRDDHKSLPSFCHTSFPLPIVDSLLATIKRHGSGCCSGGFYLENTESLLVRKMTEIKRDVNIDFCTDDPEPAESLQATTSRLKEIELQRVTLAMHRNLVYAASVLDIDDCIYKERMHDESYSWINQGSTAGYFYQN